LNEGYGSFKIIENGIESSVDHKRLSVIVILSITLSCKPTTFELVDIEI